MNHRTELLAVRHTELSRVTEESAYRSTCPTCKRGMLLVTRDGRTMHLSRFDRCTICGQRVVYLDTEIHGEPLTPVWMEPPPGVIQERTREALLLEPDEVVLMRTGKICPTCRSGRVHEGPHGGSAVNWLCDFCEAIYCDMGPFGVERVQP